VSRTYVISQGIFKPPLEVQIDGVPPCLFCGVPVESPSMNGPLVCGPCDMGCNPDGSRWTAEQHDERQRHLAETIERYRSKP